MIFEILIFIAFLVLLKVYVIVSQGKCKSNKNLSGKTILITGANRGIGYETALNLAKRGARLIITSENEQAIIEARERLIVASGNKNIIAKYLDLRSLALIRQFVKDILSTEERLDVLINNAGTVGLGTEKTKDGILPIMQVNHFGPFLLTILLLDLLKKSAPSRIVNVSSVLSQTAWIPEKYLHKVPNLLQQTLQYSKSKYYVLLTTLELADRLKGTGVTVNCLHPGYVRTEIFKNAKETFIKCMSLPAYFMKSPTEGAQTTIHLAACESVEGVTGKYFSDCRESYVWAQTNVSRRETAWKNSVKLAKLQPEELLFNKDE